MINTGAGDLLDAFGGLVILALGVFVLAVRPRRAINRAFFLYGAGFGLMWVLFNLFRGQEFGGGDFVWAMAVAAAVAAVVGLVWLGAAYPTPMAGPEKVAAVVTGIAVLAWWAIGVLTSETAGRPIVVAFGMDGRHAEAYFWATNGLLLVFAGMLWYFVVAIVRFAHGARGHQHRPEFAVLSASLLLHWGLNMGSLLVPLPELRWVLATGIAAGYGVALAWLLVTPGPHAAVGRNMALLFTGLPLIGLSVATFAGFAALDRWGLYGIARILGAAIIAYAIVRHQILGIDVKVRWTISRSTLAAAFIAVFFVASELAAEVLGGTAIGPIAGIVAAGVLVFFLAPLQRWADRVAGAATGDAKRPDEMTMSERDQAYLRAAQAAWADGNLSLNERRMLDELADVLALPADKAKALEGQASRIVTGVARHGGALG